MRFKIVLRRPKATFEEARKYTIFTNHLETVDEIAGQLFSRIPKDEWPECTIDVWKIQQILVKEVKATDVLDQIEKASKASAV